MIEARFFKSMVGDSGMRCLQDATKRYFPAVERTEITVGAAQKNVKKLQTTKLYKFAGSAAQGIVDTAWDWLEALANEKPPVFPFNTSEFQESLRDNLGYFLKHEVKGKYVFGKDAADLKFDALATKASTDDIKLVVTFGWLLEDDKRAKATKMLNDTRATAAKSMAAVAQAKSMKSSASSSADGAGPAKKQKTPELAAALAMFGRSGA